MACSENTDVVVLQSVSARDWMRSWRALGSTAWILRQKMAKGCDFSRQERQPGSDFFVLFGRAIDL